MYKVSLILTVSSILACNLSVFSSNKTNQSKQSYIFKKEIIPFLDKYCYRCHDNETQKGNIRLDNIDKLKHKAHLKLLDKIQTQTFTGNMPPENKAQPTEAERDRILTSVAVELKKYNASTLEDKLQYYKYGNYINHEKLFSGEIKDKPYTPSRRWRVNNFIYYDLIGRVLGHGHGRWKGALVNPFNLPGGSGVKDYANKVIENGESITLLSNAEWVTNQQLKVLRFLNAKRNFFIQIETDNEYKKFLKNKSPSEADIIKILRDQHVKVLKQPLNEYSKGRAIKDINKNIKTKGSAESIKGFIIRLLANKYKIFRPDKARVSKLYEKFMDNGSPSDYDIKDLINSQFEKALQRQPIAEELARYLEFTKTAIKEGGNTEGIKIMMTAVLMESDFLYRSEIGDGRIDRYGRSKLTPREASYAIAYALTDSVPDKNLVEAVKSNTLGSKKDYEREVKRILEDDKIRKPRLLRFFQDYFGYYKIFDIFKDEKRFDGGNYNPHQPSSNKFQYKMPGKLSKEADLLINDILKKDQNVLEELLTTEKFIVDHNGDNEFMKKAVDQAIKRDEVHREFVRYLHTQKDWRKKKGAARKAIDLMSKKYGKKHFDPPHKFERIIPHLILRFGEDGNKPVGTAIPPSPTANHSGVYANQVYNIDYFNWSYPAVQPFKVNNRMGFLTHPAWLISHSQNDHTDPIIRGKWMQEKLLAGFIPDVPITVDAKIPQDHHRTLRERLSVTEKPECWGCHKKMNPLGYTLENFDDFGRFRSNENLEHSDNIIGTEKIPGARKNNIKNIYKTKPVNTLGYLNGTGDKTLDGKVKDYKDLMTRLAKSERVRQTFVRHVFRYFMGRNEMLSDSQTLIEADKAYVKSGGSFNALVISLLTSDSFIYRKTSKKDSK